MSEVTGLRPRRGYVAAPHGQVHYSTLGAGPPLVLLGPAPRSIAAFEPLMQALPGLRTIAVDQPGFGGSDPLPSGASMDDIAGCVTHVLDVVEPGPVHLFGLHTGAKVAAAFAALQPRRVRTLTVCGKSHSLVPDRERRNAAMRAVVHERYFSPGAMAADPVRAWTATWRNFAAAWWPDGLFTQAWPGALIAALERKLADDLTARATVRDSYAANFQFDFAAALARAEAPVCVVEITSDAEDATVGRQGGALAAYARNGRCVTLPDTDPTGLFLHAGTEPLAGVLREIAGGT
ncbi:MAG: alpha/beta fold hydrolase [Gammaproteobacteria bacterium]